MFFAKSSSLTYGRAQIIPGVVESLKVMTREKCIQIAKFAFDYAVREGRSKVTCVHKANIMYAQQL